MATLGARYIVDEQGNRVAVVLDIEKISTSVFRPITCSIANGFLGRTYIMPYCPKLDHIAFIEDKSRFMHFAVN